MPRPPATTTPARTTPARPMRSMLLLTLVLTLVLTACASADTAGDEGDQVGLDPTPTAAAAADEGTPTAGEGTDDDPSTPTAPPADPTAGAPLNGTIGGSTIEGGCIWLDAEDGTRYELIAGPDSQVAVDPGNRVIADTQGNVIAEDGDSVAVVGQVDPGMVSFCQVGTILLVSDVTPR